MRPSPSSNMRSARTFSASRSACSGRSSCVTPSSTSSPGPISATRSPATVTEAPETRWTRARTALRLGRRDDRLQRGLAPGGPLALALGLDEPERQRRGLADVVALRVVDAERRQQLERLLVADHLRDRALAEAARDVHDGLDHELVRAVAEAGAHELAVDLEVVERQVLEVVEARERGAEVVEREAALDQLQQLRVARRAAGDVDLEDQAVVARELLAEHLDRPPDDPPVDRADQVIALGHRQERRG